MMASVAPDVLLRSFMSKQWYCHVAPSAAATALPASAQPPLVVATNSATCTSGSERLV